MKNSIFFCLISLLIITGCSNNNVQDDNNTILSDMESLNCWMNPQNVSIGNAHSGMYSCKMTKDMEYGFGYLNSFEKIGKNKPKKVAVNFWGKMSKPLSDLILVISIDSAGTNKFWEGKPLVKYFGKTNEWEEVTEIIPFSIKSILPSYNIAIYVWNKGKNEFVYDDLKITFKY